MIIPEQWGDWASIGDNEGIESICSKLSRELVLAWVSTDGDGI